MKNKKREKGCLQTDGVEQWWEDDRTETRFLEKFREKMEIFIMIEREKSEFGTNYHHLLI
jgi:hypothetical protein